MTLLALSNQLQPESLPLEQIHLDPNNPRFVDSNWVTVPDSEIADPIVQERVRKRLINGFSVDKLRMNMEVNGYLPIDRVIVREVARDQYVALEGNRRICAAKLIGEVALDGSELSGEVLESLKMIPVLVYTGGDVEAAWIFQGLRHISGVHDWSAFNKAKLLVEQMENEGLSLTDVGRRFGLSPHGAGQWVRGFYAFKQAREESDFVSEVDERSYPYFQELFSRSSAGVREWLEWDETARQFKNLINFNEFVGWLYPRPVDEDGETADTALGDFDRRWLARRDDIRDVAVLMRDEPDLFQQFRTSGRLEDAYSLALTRHYERQAKEKADPISDSFDAIRTCTRALENLPAKVLKDPDLKVVLDDLLIALDIELKFLQS